MKKLIELQANERLLQIHFIQVWNSYKKYIRQNKEYINKIEAEYPKIFKKNDFTRISLKKLFSNIHLDHRYHDIGLYEGEANFPKSFFCFWDDANGPPAINTDPLNFPFLYIKCQKSTFNDLVSVSYTDCRDHVLIFNSTGEHCYVGSTANNYDDGFVSVKFLQENYVTIESYDENNGSSVGIYQYVNGEFHTEAKISDMRTLNIFNENNISWGLRNIDTKLLADSENIKEIILKGLKNDISGILSIPRLITIDPVIFQDRNFVLELIELECTILEYLPIWSDDYEIGLSAVQQDSRSFAYLSENLRNNKEIVLIAYESDPYSILKCGDEIKRDPEIALLYEKQKYDQEQDDLPF